MARTSRKQNFPVEQLVPKAVAKPYQAGIYARLSVEDGGNGQEDSLKNQIEMVKAYSKKLEDIEITEIYCDNGRTGTNFHRPEFSRMMEDVKNEKINCIIVKDLSRFGRNFLEVGNYIERIFPLLGVRFISIGEAYDSREGNTEMLMIAFKNLLNDFYAKDISSKSIASLRMKQKEGAFLSGRPPYGYQRDRNDKYHLVLDMQSAPVVKRIFQMKREGMSNFKIARQLNREGIVSPQQYRQENVEKNKLWTERSVYYILTNQVYLGYIIIGKTEKNLMNKHRRMSVPEEKREVFSEKHEPIINEDIFWQVQELLQETKRKWKDSRIEEYPKTENIFRDIIYCGYCSTKLVRSREKSHTKNPKIYYTFRCRTYRDNGTMACHLKGRTSEKEIEEIISILLKTGCYLTNKKDIDTNAQEENLSNKMLNTWVDKITIYQDKRIQIVLY